MLSITFPFKQFSGSHLTRYLKRAAVKSNVHDKGTCTNVCFSSRCYDFSRFSIKSSHTKIRPQSSFCPAGGSFCSQPENINRIAISFIFTPDFQEAPLSISQRKLYNFWI